MAARTMTARTMTSYGALMYPNTVEEMIASVEAQVLEQSRLGHLPPRDDCIVMSAASLLDLARRVKGLEANR